MADGPACTLIVAVYEHSDFLEKLFVSFLNQTRKDFEIIVADDGSGPAVKEVVERYRLLFPYPVRHVWHEHEGFRKTIIINKAVCRSSADYLVFIDGDCILHHRFIEFHLKRRQQGTVLSGRRVMLSEAASSKVTLDLIRSKGIQKVWFWWGRCNRQGYLQGLFLPGMFTLRNRSKRKRCDILGCNFSVYKSDFLKVNGYDERIIGRGMEDDNLSARFQCAGVETKTMAFEALEYHLHHSADPIPHGREAIAEFRDNITNCWTPFGIVKSPVP